MAFQQFHEEADLWIPTPKMRAIQGQSVANGLASVVQDGKGDDPPDQAPFSQVLVERRAGRQDLAVRRNVPRATDARMCAAAWQSHPELVVRRDQACKWGYDALSGPRCG